MNSIAKPLPPVREPVPQSKPRLVLAGSERTSRAVIKLQLEEERKALRAEGHELLGQAEADGLLDRNERLTTPPRDEDHRNQVIEWIGRAAKNAEALRSIRGRK